MRVTSLPPSEFLAPYVREFTIVETGEEATRVLVPDTGVIAGFRFGGSADLIEAGGAARMPDAALTGLRSTSRRMRTAAGGGIVLAVFRGSGASAFFPEPLHEVFGETLALDDLIAHRDVDDVLSRVGEAKDNAERVAAVEAFLLRRQLQRTPDAIVAHAARAIEMTHGSIRVGALARRLGVTQNALERRFRERVGATPKQFASIVRLRHAVELQRSGATLTQVATEAGYFDQPHWNRQFRSAMGQAPQRFFTESEYC